WRIWRVIDVGTLQGRNELRLAAAGRNGLPPLWPPLRPMAAVCSKFDSRHEAPWPDHDCGVYALRTRRLAEEVLEAMVAGSNGDGAEAWAIGRVSLWGRVVECERGWRGQYAYPYELTLLADDEALARRLAGVYAVEVGIGEEATVYDAEADDGEDKGSRLLRDLAAARLAAIAAAGETLPEATRLLTEVARRLPGPAITPLRAPTPTTTPAKKLPVFSLPKGH